MQLPVVKRLSMQRASISLNRDQMAWAFQVWCSECPWHVPALDVDDATEVLARHLESAHAPATERMEISQ